MENIFNFRIPTFVIKLLIAFFIRSRSKWVYKEENNYHRQIQVLKTTVEYNFLR